MICLPPPAVGQALKNRTPTLPSTLALSAPSPPRREQLLENGNGLDDDVNQALVAMLDTDAPGDWDGQVRT